MGRRGVKSGERLFARGWATDDGKLEQQIGLNNLIVAILLPMPIPVRIQPAVLAGQDPMRPPPQPRTAGRNETRPWSTTWQDTRDPAHDGAAQHMCTWRWGAVLVTNMAECDAATSVDVWSSGGGVTAQISPAGAFLTSWRR